MNSILWLIKKTALLLVKLPFMLVRLPYKVFRFMMDHAILLGIYVTVKSILKASFKVLRQPFFLGMLIGSSLLFVLIDQERRKKVFALVKRS